MSLSKPSNSSKATVTSNATQRLIKQMSMMSQVQHVRASAAFRRASSNFTKAKLLFEVEASAQVVAEVLSISQPTARKYRKSDTEIANGRPTYLNAKEDAQLLALVDEGFSAMKPLTKNQLIQKVNKLRTSVQITILHINHLHRPLRFSSKRGTYLSDI